MAVGNIDHHSSAVPWAPPPPYRRQGRDGRGPAARPGQAAAARAFAARPLLTMSAPVPPIHTYLRHQEASRDSAAGDGPPGGRLGWVGLPQALPSLILPPPAALTRR